MRPFAPAAGASNLDIETMRDVVPARLVLTELARGFLLVHKTDPARAARFALTFLQERAGNRPIPRVESVPAVTLARLSLGRLPRGAIEPRATPR